MGFCGQLLEFINFFQHGVLTHVFNPSFNWSLPRFVSIDFNKCRFSCLFSAAGFASKTRYLFGRFSVQMKVHPGDSAGTVSTFYVSHLERFAFCVSSGH